MNTYQQVCLYCDTCNPGGTDTCIACGAPLPFLPAPSVELSFVEETPEIPSSTNVIKSLTENDQLKEGLKAVGAVAGTLGVGAILLRLLVGAIAIAISGLIIGLNGGTYAAGLLRAPGILLLTAAAGALLGLSVVLAKKRTLLTLFSAPVGTLLGTMLALLLPDPSSRFPLGVLSAAAGGVLFAFLGQRNPHPLPRRCLTVLHPLLGALGGLLFALLGYAITHMVP